MCTLWVTDNSLRTDHRDFLFSSHRCENKANNVCESIRYMSLTGCALTADNEQLEILLSEAAHSRDYRGIMSKV